MSFLRVSRLLFCIGVQAVEWNQASLVQEPWVFQPYEGQQIRWLQTQASDQFVKQQTLDINVALFHQQQLDQDERTAYSSEAMSLESQAKNSCLLIQLNSFLSLPVVDAISQSPKDPSLTRQLYPTKNSSKQRENSPPVVTHSPGNDRHSISHTLHGSQCHQAVRKLDLSRDILLCGALLRIPRAENWDYWRHLENRERSGGASNRTWQTVDPFKLQAELLEVQVKAYKRWNSTRSSDGTSTSATLPRRSIYERSPYFPDGTRKSYLEFKLSEDTQRKLLKWLAGGHSITPRPVCYLTQTSQANVGTIPNFNNVIKVAE